MSAFIAIKTATSVELMTDGAVYSDDGTLLSVRRKVWHSDVVPLVITGRGNMDQMEKFAVLLVGIANASGSFDHTIESLEAMLARRRGVVQQENSEFLICGISERGGPVILHFATIQVTGYPEAWTLTDCGDDVLAGSEFVPPEYLYRGKDFIQFAPAIMEWARSKKATNPTKPNMPPLHGIGGRLDHTSITEQQIIIECVHKWPDVVGEKIDPFRIEGALRCAVA